MKFSKVAPKPHVVFFEPNPDFATNPTLLCLVDALKQEGYQIDILMPTNCQYPVLKKWVSLYPYTTGFRKTGKNPYQILKKIFIILRRIKLELLFATKIVKFIIGVDSKGIIKAVKFRQRYKTPVIYINFEIFFWDELTNRMEFEEKKNECDASKLINFVIIQDDLRAQLLSKENNIPLKRFLYLPVSPKSETAVEKSDYLRKKFCIDNKIKIVLHSGSFGDWTYAEELIQSIKYWPKDYILVIHTRYVPGKNDSQINIIKSSIIDNVILSEDPLDVFEYQKLISSADIGLVLYKSVSRSIYTQKNIENIGFASGKFSYYMKYGLPVISIKQLFYKDLLKDYRFGENINMISELPESLERISENYNYFSEEAKRLFKDRLDFNLFWPDIYSELKNLAKDKN